MQKKLHSLSIALLLIIGISFISCSESEETISEKLIGTWQIENQKTVYNQGLLNQLTNTVDKETMNSILKNASVLFENSRLTFNSNLTGEINKNLIGNTTNKDNWIATILGGLSEKLVNVNYTYKVSAGKVTIKILEKEYELTLISITENKLKIALKVVDLSNLTASLLGGQIKNITENDSFKQLTSTITSFGSQIGTFLNPTIIMEYNK